MSVSSEICLSTPCLAEPLKRKRANTIFFSPPDSVDNIYPSFFFSLPSKIHLWIAKLTSGTAWKTNRPLRIPAVFVDAVTEETVQ